MERSNIVVCAMHYNGIGQIAKPLFVRVSVCRSVNIVTSC